MKQRRGKTLIEVFGLADNPLHPSRIEVWNPRTRSWSAYESPMCQKQLLEARNLYLEDVEQAIRDKQTLDYVPQTTARMILLRVAPELRDIDLILAGAAVTSDRVRVEGEELPRSKRWRRAKAVMQKAIGW